MNTLSSCIAVHLVQSPYQQALCGLPKQMQQLNQLSMQSHGLRTMLPACWTAGRNGCSACTARAWAVRAASTESEWTHTSVCADQYARAPHHAADDAVNISAVGHDYCTRIAACQSHCQGIQSILQSAACGHGHVTYLIPGPLLAGPDKLPEAENAGMTDRQTLCSISSQSCWHRCQSHVVVTTQGPYTPDRWPELHAMQQTRPEDHWSMSAFVAPLSLLDLLVCRALRMLQLTGVLFTNNQSGFDSNAYDPSIGMRHHTGSAGLLLLCREQTAGCDPSLPMTPGAPCHGVKWFLQDVLPSCITDMCSCQLTLHGAS